MSSGDEFEDSSLKGNRHELKRAAKDAKPVYIDVEDPSEDEDALVIPVSADKRPKATARKDLFPALSEPFDETDEPASKILAAAKKAVSGGQLLPEAGFVAVATILLSEKLPGSLRTSAFVLLNNVAESVAHVRDLCASGNLAQLYAKRVAEPIENGTLIMNEDLNGFLHVLDEVLPPAPKA